MLKKMTMITAVGILALGVSATSALAFSCPKLIGAGRRVAAKATGPNKAKALALLDEAMALHKSGSHKKAMQKATQGVVLVSN